MPQGVCWWKSNYLRKIKTCGCGLRVCVSKSELLRDLNADFELLERSYFPNVDLSNFEEVDKKRIIEEIEVDFNEALPGIFQLPAECRLGVYTAHKYYFKLLMKLKRTPSKQIKIQEYGPQLPKNGSFGTFLC